MYSNGKKLFIFLVVLVFAILPLLFILTSCSPIDPTDIINDLFPNAWVFCAHIFATIILIGCMTWLVWKPTRNSITKRHNYIANQIREAEQARHDAFLKLNEAEQEKIKAFEQAHQIIERATNQAYIQKEQIEAQAKINIKKIEEDAKNEGTKLQNQIRQTMEQEILDIAFEATKTLLRKKINRQHNNELVKEVIDSYSDRKGVKDK